MNLLAFQASMAHKDASDETVKLEHAIWVAEKAILSERPGSVSEFVTLAGRRLLQIQLVSQSFSQSFDAS